jgi:sugar/nucleoside kinase (ribokinase family)
MRNLENLSSGVFKSTNLCVVGNINRDIKLAPVAPGGYLCADGETPVAWTAETPGGGGANSACAAAALGARVAFLGKVGADALGQRLQDVLTSHGVLAKLSRSPECQTGTSVNLAFSNGSRHFISCLPNNEALRFEDLDLTGIENYRHLLRSDVWFSTSMLAGGNERLFRYAQQIGLRTSLDINWDPQWNGGDAQTIVARKLALRKVLPWVNLAHGNTKELMEFTGADDLDRSLHQLEEWGVESVVVHLGEKGSGYYTHGALVTSPAIPAARRVNTTGTGDVLSVCMVLLDGTDTDVKEKLRFANQIVAEFIAGERKLIPEL